MCVGRGRIAALCVTLFICLTTISVVECIQDETDEEIWNTKAADVNSIFTGGDMDAAEMQRLLDAIPRKRMDNLKAAAKHILGNAQGIPRDLDESWKNPEGIPKEFRKRWRWWNERRIKDGFWDSSEMIPRFIDYFEKNELIRVPLFWVEVFVFGCRILYVDVFFQTTNSSGR